MKSVDLRYRQVHLDFHTSEAITGIGSGFDETEFIEALTIANVDTVNLFAICHHGWAYYDSKLGYKHPHLATNLLERQMSAAKRAGVRTVVYNTVRWNARVARLHPEWIVRNPDGSKAGPTAHSASSLPYYAWDSLCLNSPYIEEFVLPSTEEIMDLLDPSGLFMDITFKVRCACRFCQARMTDLGLDWQSEEDLETMARQTRLDYLAKVSRLVWGKDPDATLYHNDHQVRGEPEMDEHYSHREIESLPTGEWGYSHFPCNASFFNQDPNVAMVGMTGKFHTSWGEFGGYKHPNAMRWEVAQITSLGGRACIGDHLHPSGKVDLDTYRLIGTAYSELKHREPWLRGAQNVADIGIVVSGPLLTSAESGAGKMLLETQTPFAMIDATADFSQFKLLVLPDEVRLASQAIVSKLQAFAAAGGKIIASGFSGLDADDSAFLLDFGVKYLGRSDWESEYIKESAYGTLLESGISNPFLVYHSGTKVALRGGERLAATWQPYFNRTVDRHCGHREAPYEKATGGPAVTLKGNFGYISQRIFTSYDKWGVRLYRELVAGLLRRLLPEPTVSIRLPSAGRVALTRQSERRSYILHALYATPIQRGEVGVIEDVVPLHDVSVSLRLPETPIEVRCVPDGETINFRSEGPIMSFVIPKVELSQMVEIRYR